MQTQLHGFLFPNISKKLWPIDVQDLLFWIHLQKIVGYDKVELTIKRKSLFNRAARRWGKFPRRANNGPKFIIETPESLQPTTQPYSATINPIVINNVLKLRHHGGNVGANLLQSICRIRLRTPAIEIQVFEFDIEIPFEKALSR